MEKEVLGSLSSPPWSKYHKTKMSNLLRRAKNLWDLSAYRPDLSAPLGKEKNKFELKKDVATVKPKPATIIPEEPEDFFKPE
jgi:hypothetical protein